MRRIDDSLLYMVRFKQHCIFVSNVLACKFAKTTLNSPIPYPLDTDFNENVEMTIKNSNKFLLLKIDIKKCGCDAQCVYACDSVLEKKRTFITCGTFQIICLSFLA